MNTPIETQASILAELWMDYRDEEYFAEFFQYADIGFPLAYVISKGVVKTTPEADKFISDTWEVFMGLCGHEEDTGFDSLEDVLANTDLDEDFKE
jgi:hypothetical protein